MACSPLVGFQWAARRGIGGSQLRPARPRLHKWHDFQRIRGALPPTGQAEAQARRTRLTRAVHAQGHQKVTLCWPPLQTRALFALSSSSGASSKVAENVWPLIRLAHPRYGECGAQWPGACECGRICSVQEEVVWRVGGGCAQLLALRVGQSVARRGLCSSSSSWAPASIGQLLYRLRVPRRIDWATAKSSERVWCLGFQNRCSNPFHHRHCILP
ncbi:hypothetical protein L1887_58292 [Cichorium endivia]|nr:hypothetical protein L1887_58292 [Cichorium endivia]